MDYAKYYSILKLPTTATSEEVKRAYRRLAAQYHPDRNPDGAAMFLLVKEAYEVLTGKVTITTQSTTRQSSPSATTSRSENRNATVSREERIRMAKKRYEEQLRKEEEKDVRFYNNLVSGKSFSWFKYGALYSLVMAILLSLDIILPPIKPNQQANFINYISPEVAEQLVSKIREEMQDSTIQMNQLTINGVDSFGNYEYSRIFREKFIVLSSTIDQSTERIGSNDTLWGIILFLVIPIFALWYKRMNAMFILLFYTSLYILIPISLLISVAKIYTLCSYWFT